MQQPSADRLLPLVDEQLRKAAQRDPVGERVGHTLSATALVREAYVKLRCLAALARCQEALATETGQ